MSSAWPATDVADSPYDSTTVADTIIRSSDNVHFYVLGGLLRFVSPFFRDMFDLNHGPAAEQTEKRDGLPIIPLPEEDSATIRLLLDFLYPCVKEPQLYDVELLWKVGKAVKKYCMDIIENKLIYRIVESKLIDQQPLSIYAVATDLEWEDVANSAARKTLKIPLKSLPYVEELQSITGTDFYRFLEYRLRYDRSAQPEEEKLATAFTSASTADAVDSQVSSHMVEDLPCRFRPSPIADLILCSSDSVEFFVTSGMIRAVSPVFDKMFPLKDHGSKDGRPVIFVQEIGKVLHQLLRILYHDVDELEIDDYRTYMGVVTAARRYEMTAIERKLQRQVQKSALVLKEPLRIYLLAARLGWKDVEKIAALNTLSRSLQEMVYIAELDLVTGADLYRLVHFRFQCEDEAYGALQADENFVSYGVDNWDGYRRARPSYYYNYSTSDEVSDWQAKLRARPRGSTMTDIYEKKILEIRNRGGDTYELSFDAFTGIIKCARDAEKVVEDAVSKVALD